MDLRALKRHASSRAHSHELPSRADLLAEAVDGTTRAAVIASRRRSRFWLHLHNNASDVPALIGCAETASLRLVKDWLSRFALHELTIAGTVTLHGRCPMERVQQGLADATAPVGTEPQLAGTA